MQRKKANFYHKYVFDINTTPEVILSKIEYVTVNDKKVKLVFYANLKRGFVLYYDDNYLPRKMRGKVKIHWKG